MKHGFTLFEVMISLLIMTVAVTSVMALMPAGVRAQERARYQVYAAAKTLEIMQGWSNAGTSMDRMWHEQQATGTNNQENLCNQNYLWQNRLGRAAKSDANMPMMPLPDAIARRIDSEDDEIQRILDAGGRIFYGNPSPLTGGGYSTALENALPNEASKLVFAVVGHAQNPLIRHPEISWPYYEWYPSPPQHKVDRLYELLDSPGFAEAFWYEDKSLGDVDPRLFFRTSPGVADNIDLGAASVDRWRSISINSLKRHDQWFFKNRNPSSHGTDEDRRYEVEAVLHGLASSWYYAEEVLGIDPLLGGPDVSLSQEVLASYIPSPQEVRVWRFLAYFGMRMTTSRFQYGPGYRVYDPGGNLINLQISDAPLVLRLEKGDAAGAVTWSKGNVTISEDLVRTWHEKSIRCAMNYAAHFPYRWDVQRMLQREMAWDHPLLQYDLFPAQNHPYETASIPRWPIMAPIDMDGSATWNGLDASWYGPAMGRFPTSTSAWGNQERTYGPQNRPEIERGWAWSSGDATWPRRFTATRPFTGADRCRELVFWSVDWQSWEDFESCPPDPADSATWPYRAGSTNMINRRNRPTFRFPEHHLFFQEAAASTLSKGFPSATAGSSGAAEPFWGLHGVDRNGNERLDAGPLPVDARQRATPIARFNIYESIATASVIR
ncbi:MAG: prepilin-type N-terminal cleavage/methylation domain-containing protein [Planctomycetota bacterium]|jgi:prepilin-type N-terminal cleavage/methylation domain-containing protein|nr:prepilin-type N-terminal cleavage/methylation domain-containing protein [Planctomycetota bacterium]